MKWFRLYSEVVHDSKVQTLPAPLFRSWINVLCMANENEPRGRLPDLRQIAFTLRISEGEATAVVEQLKAAGLLETDDSGALMPHGWGWRQSDSDDVNRRVQKFRDSKRKKRSSKKLGDVTLHETLHETDRKRYSNVTCNVVEEIRREETRGGEFAPAPAPACEGTPARPLTPLPGKPVGGPLTPAADLDPEVEPFDHGRRDPLPAFAPKHPFTEAALSALIAKAERLFPGAEFGPRVSQIAGSYPLAWIDRALEAMHAAGKRSWPYLLSILQRYEREGGPDPPRANSKSDSSTKDPVYPPLMTDEERRETRRWHQELNAKRAGKATS